MNWYDLLTAEEWHYQAVTYSKPKPRLCPVCGAAMGYYYGWYCAGEYPGLMSDG